MKQVINNLEKGDFPLAEWKEILSGNCFSHTAGVWGWVYVMRHVRAGSCFFVDRLCLTFPPTHPRVFQLFISLLNNMNTPIKQVFGI